MFLGKSVYLLSLLKKIIFFGLSFGWVIASILLIYILRLKPEILLIEINSSGNRVVEIETDSLHFKESDQLVKVFLKTLYHYNSKNYEEKISKAGDLMSESLWKIKEKEFQSLRNELSQKLIHVYTEVLDLKLIESCHYQAELLISVQEKIKTKKIKIQVDLYLKEKQRTRINPYPYEIFNYEEKKL